MSRNFILFLGAVMLLSSCSSNPTSEQESAAQPSETEASTKVKAEETQRTEETAGKEKEDQIEEESADSKEASLPLSPKYRINQNNWSIELIEQGEEKPVLLTIDDAPDKHSLDMAKKMDQLGVKAIFFVNGHFLDTPEEAEILKQIHELGFPIGNHTYNHESLPKLSEEKQIEEIISLNDRVEEIIGVRPQYFRAPFGQNTEVSFKVAEEEKMTLMNWTYGYDWEKDYLTKEKLADIMVNTPLLNSGANLLMHDREWTSAALEDIVKGLQAKSYTIADPALIETPK
ncbi:polysaccharide deacetylase family protein [Mesobacillus harenae]|uniref:polysaccharide deacetylase family protein n=1 Tax=Mesobacillus harenae TaxID=2213203 RepID=UPI00158006F1|nr:polysaccharide deacetylase family protein [Mesobacillus harenae]